MSLQPTILYKEGLYIAIKPSPTNNKSAADDFENSYLNINVNLLNRVENIVTKCNCKC